MSWLLNIYMFLFGIWVLRLAAHWVTSKMKPETAEMGQQSDVAKTSKQPGNAWMPKELMREIVQETLGLCSMRPKFNVGQCDYLVAKLKVAVKRGNEFLESVKSEYETSFTADEREEFLEVMKMLRAFGTQAKSIVEECCEDAWIQAAVKMGNVPERISSIGFNLAVCVGVFSDSRKWGESENSVSLTELVDRVYKDEVEAVRKRAVCDKDALIEKLIGELKSLLSTVRALFRISRTCRVEDLNIMDDKSLEAKVQSTKMQLFSSISPYALGDKFLDNVGLLDKLKATVESLIKLEDELKISSTAPLIQKIRDQHRLISLLFKRLEQIPGTDIRGSIPEEFVLKDIKRLISTKDYLGHGSSGVVFRAVYAGFHVAKKIIHQPSSPAIDKEVSIQARMYHPNVSSLICFVRDEREQTIITGIMDKDLSKLIKERLDLRRTIEKKKTDGKEKEAEGEGDFPFPMLVVVDIMLQVAGGMYYVHGLKIGHRDLKPENILVRKVAESEYVLVEITDFGVSKVEETRKTCMTYNTGTSRYMAPEVIKLEGGAKSEEMLYGEVFSKVAKCDVHSFAMVCYELLTGYVPFKDISPFQFKDMILHKKRPNLLDLPDRCPKRLKNLIQGCWSLDPNDRPSFGDICKELRCIKYELLFTCAWRKIPSSVHHCIVPPTKQDPITSSAKEDPTVTSIEEDLTTPSTKEETSVASDKEHGVEDVKLSTCSQSTGRKILIEDIKTEVVVREDVTEDYFNAIDDHSTLSGLSEWSTGMYSSTELEATRTLFWTTTYSNRAWNKIQDFSEMNSMYFEELKRRQSSRISQNSRPGSGGNATGFLQDMNDLVLGRKIGEGGEAEIFEAGERYVVKVFKNEFPLEELEDSLPLGLLNAFDRNSIQESPLSSIVGATLLKEEGYFNRFAIVQHKKCGDLRTLIDLRIIGDRSYLSSPFTKDQVLKLMFGIAKDMLTLHRQDPPILHRDLKAANVLVQGPQLPCLDGSNVLVQGSEPPSLDGGFEVTVCDFERSNGVFGTGFWRAPEILHGMMMRVGSSKLSRCFTEKSDVYSYGMTCYELVTGCIPFQNRNKSYSNYSKVVIDKERPILPESVPPVAVDLIQKCWQHDPSKRPSFQDIVDYLKAYAKLSGGWETS